MIASGSVATGACKDARWKVYGIVPFRNLIMENIKVVGQADTLKSIPGNPNWHLAPIEMAWEGKTLGQICEQIKDKARNGNMDNVGPDMDV